MYKTQKKKRPICHPRQYRDGIVIDGTCQTKKNIEDLTSVYGSKYGYGTKFSYSGSEIIPNIKNINLEEWWKELKKNTNCEDEICVTSKLAPSLQNRLYAPKKPKKWKLSKSPNRLTRKQKKQLWWYSYELETIMKQYEEAYPNYRFLFPSYINYDTIEKNTGSCVTPEICNLQISDYLSKGITDIGIIFNTARNNQPGEHWVCVYIQLQPEHKIVYFDSTGYRTPPEIVRLMKTIQKQDPEMEKIILNKVHQKKDGECGTYCIFTLLLLLTGKTHLSSNEQTKTWQERINYLKNKQIDDDSMYFYRRKLVM